MEDMTVVSFFVDREGVAWDGKWIFQIRQTYFSNEVHRLKYMEVGLPFWDRADTMWQVQRQKEYLSALPIPAEGRGVCHVCDKESFILFGLKPATLSMEWGLFLLEYYRHQFDGLVIFEDREMEASALALRFTPLLPYVGVVSANPWRWEEVSEYILEEYGYQIEVAPSFTKLHPKGKHLLLWSGRDRRGLSPLTIPGESIWLDTQCDNASSQRMEIAHSKKVFILNLNKFLHDFCAKSCIGIGKKV